MKAAAGLRRHSLRCEQPCRCGWLRRVALWFGFLRGFAAIVAPVRIIGIDPGLRTTGWGVIEATGSRLVFVACGAVRSDGTRTLAERLLDLHRGLGTVIATHAPHEAAVEETFVNRDPRSALKLGHARAVALLVPALAGLAVAEYAALLVKKTVTGAGHAEKAQVAMMVKVLLPRSEAAGPDAADALAVAITHAQYRGAAHRLARLAPGTAGVTDERMIGPRP